MWKCHMSIEFKIYYFNGLVAANMLRTNTIQILEIPPNLKIIFRSFEDGKPVAHVFELSEKETKELEGELEDFSAFENFITDQKNSDVEEFDVD